MKIHVRLMVTREQIVEGRTLDLEVAASACIGDALRELAERDRNLIGPVLGADFSLRPGLALLHNGVNVLHSSDGVAVRLAEGDSLSFIHGISGG